MTRGSVLVLFAGEAAVLGGLGGAIGVPAGIGLGRLAMMVMQHQVELVLPMALDQVFTSPRTLGIAWLVGVAASALAAVAPAARAATVRPRDAIEHGAVQVQMQSHPLPWTIAGAVCLALSALCYLPALRHSSFVVYGAEIALILGVVAMTPLLSLLLSRALAVVGALSIHARLAVDHVRRARQVTTVTVSALAVGVCLAVASASVTRSFKVSAEHVLTESLPADLFIRGGSHYVGQSGTLMAESMVARAGQTPGVAGAAGIRLNPTYLFRGEVIALLALDAHTYLQHAQLILRGDRASAFAQVEQGTGAIVSENFASHFHVRIGDTLMLDSPTGPVAQKVGAFYLDYLSPTGVVLIDRAVYKRRFLEPLVDSVDVFLQPGAKADDVRRAIAARFADGEQLLILKNEEVRGDLLHLIDETFLLVYAQEAVAIIVAILGILHALSVSVLERTRELGTLRAQGLTRVELIRVVLVEAALIGIMGSLIGALFGAALAHQNVTVLVAHQTGWRFEFAFAWAAVVTVSLACTLAALLAGFLPARRASLLPIAEALRFE
jgi:putative ABC transport system permease protein